MTNATEKLPWIATLVHGERYELRGKVFVHGSEVPVSEKEREHLMEHAVDVVLTPGFDPNYDHEDDKTSHRAKFEFRDNDGEPTHAIDTAIAERTPPATRRGIVAQGRRTAAGRHAE